MCHAIVPAKGLRCVHFPTMQTVGNQCRNFVGLPNKYLDPVRDPVSLTLTHPRKLACELSNNMCNLKEHADMSDQMYSAGPKWRTPYHHRQSNKWHYLHCSNCGASNALTAFPRSNSEESGFDSIHRFTDRLLYIHIIYILLNQLFQLFFSNRKLQATLLCKCKTLRMILYIYRIYSISTCVYLYFVYHYVHYLY